MVYVSDRREETLMTGATNIIFEPNFVSVSVDEMAVANVLTTYQKKIRGCDPGNEKLSVCVEDYADDKVSGCKFGPLSEGGCSVEEFIDRCAFMSRIKLHSLDWIFRDTGCRIPCRRFEHNIKTIVKEKKWKVAQREVSTCCFTCSL